MLITYAWVKQFETVTAVYLIHICLRAESESSILPDGVGDLVRAAARPEERVEHVVVHPHAQPHQVLGIYLLAERLKDAEARATALCRRVLETESVLHGWELVTAEAPLVGQFYEGLLSDSGSDGRIGPRPFPST